MSGFDVNGIIIDIVLCAVVLFSAIYGYNRGFIKSAISIVSFAVSLVCAWIFTPVLSPLICGGFMLGWVRQAVEKAMELAGISNVSAAYAAAELPNALNSILTRFGIKISDLGSSGVMSSDEIAEAIAGPTADILSKALSFVIIFFGTALLLRIIGIVIDKAMNITGLSGVNKFFGGVLGTVCGVFYAMVIAAVLRGAWPSLCAAWPDVFPKGAVEGSYLMSLTEKISFGLVADRIMRLTAK